MAAGEFANVYAAFFYDLPKLCLLCAVCHGLKTFAQNEIAVLLEEY